MLTWTAPGGILTENLFRIRLTGITGRGRMIDLHTHTFMSDGVLVPSELARRAEDKGCRIIGITDHVDFSNVEAVVLSACRACRHINGSMEIRAVPGVEITHVSPSEIAEISSIAREKGARLVVVHGETVVEPVKNGTNRKAIEAGVDILAHPGILSEDDARLAAEMKVYIEISGRGGHSFSNGRVARLWYEYGFPVLFNTDAHSPEDLVDDAFAGKLILSAGFREKDVKTVMENSSILAERLLER